MPNYIAHNVAIRQFELIMRMKNENERGGVLSYVTYVRRRRCACTTESLTRSPVSSVELGVELVQHFNKQLEILQKMEHDTCKVGQGSDYAVVRDTKNVSTIINPLGIK